MKSLNEVIKDLQEQIDDDMNCEYSSNWIVDKDDVEDAIHYMKELKEARDIIATAREEAKIQLEAFKADIMNKMTDNPPLTWEELRQMEGKPVFIDSIPLVRRWVVIKKFHPYGGNKNLFDMEVNDGAHFLRKNMRRDDPAWWQAYRKERE